MSSGWVEMPKTADEWDSVLPIGHWKGKERGQAEPSRVRLPRLFRFKDCKTIPTLPPGPPFALRLGSG